MEKYYTQMTEFLGLFELMPTWQKAGWVFICLSAGWTLENARPLVRFGYDKWSHARVNFVLLATTLAINTGFTATSIRVFAWISSNRVGLLHWTALPTWAELVIALLLLDGLAQYLAHVLLHKLPFMWRFHRVHHSDERVDVTTGTRHHPGDYVFRELVALITIILVGAPLAFYLVYRMGTVFFTYLTHANVDMPRWLDRPLSFVFVTPNLHKFHHHAELPWTDRNYGNMFSFWDRLFGTLVYQDVHSVRYGLNDIPPGKDESVRYQLFLPFS